MIGPGIAELDIHGKSKGQAKTAIDAALRRHCARAYRIRIIHGYNRGSELKEMIKTEYSEHPGILRIETGENPGITVFVLREF